MQPSVAGHSKVVPFMQGIMWPGEYMVIRNEIEGDIASVFSLNKSAF